MKVLVTGVAGFLGTHVAEHFKSIGWEVIGTDNLNDMELKRAKFDAKKSREHNLNFLKTIGIDFRKQDVREVSFMNFEGIIDFIIHCAAQPAMTISIEDPELDFSTNVRGTFNVLKVARQQDVPVVSCGTIHIYGNKINETLTEKETRYVRNPTAIDESHPVVEGSLTPLHASKRAAELYLETYIHSYGLNAASFRLTGLYGPRQFGGEDHGWVANFSIRALMERPLRIFGTGKQVRDIISPKDVARAFHAFYEHGEPGIYNIGGGPEYAISLLECIDLIGEILGKKLEIQFEEQRTGDLLYFVCDTRKAQDRLKWSPEVSPKEGVKELLEWLEEEKNLFTGDLR